MGKFSVDPSDRWRVLPKGEYEVMITKADEKEPKQGEHNFIHTFFEVIEGEYKGEKFDDRLSLSPKAKSRLAGFIYALGLSEPGTKGAQEFDTDELPNRILIVKGEPETYNGFERFRATSFKMHPDVAKTAESTMNKEASDARAKAETTVQEKPAPSRAAAAPSRRPI